MFSSKNEYELRVFLSSYRDAIHCLKQSADKATLRKNYENIANRLTIYVKQKKVQPNYMLDVWRHQHHQIRRKRYFGIPIHPVNSQNISNFDNFKGTYEQLQNTLNQAYQSLQQDFQTHSTQ